MTDSTAPSPATGADLRALPDPSDPRATAQAILAWHLHHGLAVIPKASARERLAANLAAGGVTLEPEDMAAIDTLDDPAGRLGPDPAKL